MAKYPSYPVFSRSNDRLMLTVSETLCYSWEFDGDPGALVMRRHIGKTAIAALGSSFIIDEAEFRHLAHVKLREALDYITKMAK